MVGSGPVTMTVEQRANNPAAKHSGKRFLVGLRLPIGNNFIAPGKAADLQTLFICRSATKTFQVWRVCFLDTFFVHINITREIG